MKPIHKKIICCTYDISPLDESKPFDEIPLEIFLDKHYSSIASKDRWNDNIKLNIVQKVSDFQNSEIDLSRVDIDARTISMTLLRSEESKPYIGDLDKDFLKPIDGHVFEYSTWLILPSKKLIMYVYDHHAPKQKQLQDYLNKFMRESNHFISIQRKLSKKTMDQIEQYSDFSEIQLLLNSGGKNPVFMDRKDIPSNCFATKLKVGIDDLSKNMSEIGIGQTQIKLKLDNKSKESTDSKQTILDLIKYVDIESDNVAGFKIKPSKSKDYIDLKYHDKIYFLITLTDKGYEYVAKELILKYLDLIKDGLL